MAKSSEILPVLALALVFKYGELKSYEPTWESLDKRPLPEWYDQGKIGIFIHWGLYSVPSYGTEWFWSKWKSGKEYYVNFMDKNFKPDFTYADFAPMFTAEFFDPNEWAEMFQASGAKYVVLTSKHHEGFTLWPSKYSWNWNAYDVGPKRDLVGTGVVWIHCHHEGSNDKLIDGSRITGQWKTPHPDLSDLANAIRKTTDLKFGLYYSLYEWFHPLYLRDKANNFTTRHFVLTKMMPEMHEMVNTYKPAVVWTDGDWEPTDEYWDSTGFLAWLYNDSPVKDVVVVNDRWGSGDLCKHGGYFTCRDKYIPGVLQPYKWENCMTLDRYSWGYRRNSRLEDYLTIRELIHILAVTISCGGNILINVGPTHDGKIHPIFEERLRQLGQWLNVTGEAVYSSKPWLHQHDILTKNVWYTSKPSSQGTSIVYAFVLHWPDDDELILGSVKSSTETRVTMLGLNPLLSWNQGDKGLRVTFPSVSPTKLPSQWCWVLKLENVDGIETEEMTTAQNEE